MQLALNIRQGHQGQGRGHQCGCKHGGHGQSGKGLPTKLLYPWVLQPHRVSLQRQFIGI